MSKVTLPDIGSLANNASARQAINDNFATIADAFENTLSRDGLQPNQMEADIDLNSNDLLNVNRIDASEYFKNGIPWEQSVTYGNVTYDIFSGDGVEDTFPLTTHPGSIGNLDVSVDGVTQRPDIDYVLDGQGIRFVTPPPAESQNILVRYAVAVPTGITSAESILYTPPQDGIPTSIRLFLDRLWSTAAGAGSALIRFLQSGTGAIGRTVQDKLRERVSVLDFGADPTGISDSTTAFVNASTRAGLNGRVIIPAGTYQLVGLNIGLESTSWVQEGDVLFTGGGTLNGNGFERVGTRFRFGVPGEFGQQTIDFNDPLDFSQAQMRAFRTVTAEADRAGVMHLRVNNDADDQPVACVFLDADHRGQNTTGFPTTLTAYGTARNINGAAPLAATFGIFSPASDIVGETWTTGICYGMEINYGNRWAELGLQRDHTLDKWVGGLVMSPDVLQGTDGGGTGYNYHAQYGIVFGRGQTGGQDRRHWIPILLASDGIPEGGIGIHTRGASGGNGPLAVMEAALNWQKGIDMSPASFTAGGAAFKGNALALTANGSQTEDARVFRSATGRATVVTNRTVADKFFSFMENGNYAIANPTPPASAASAGMQGEVSWDSNFIYVCIAANTWKRVAIATW